MTEVDDIVLDILGRDSPAVKGLEVADTLENQTGDRILLETEVMEAQHMGGMDACSYVQSSAKLLSNQQIAEMLEEDNERNTPSCFRPASAPAGKVLASSSSGSVSDFRKKRKSRSGTGQHTEQCSLDELKRQKLQLEIQHLKLQNESLETKNYWEKKNCRLQNQNLRLQNYHERLQILEQETKLNLENSIPVIFESDASADPELLELDEENE